jgi:hypothetical protein
MDNTHEIAGMTVNERLWHFQLFDVFDAAVASGELARVVAVLQQARFTDDQAYETASAILVNPNYYGRVAYSRGA